MVTASIIRKTAADPRKAPNWTDFQAERAAFQWAAAARRLYGKPGGAVNIATLALERSSSGEKIAYRFLARNTPAREMTYAQLAAAANRFCNVLRGLCIRPVERVFVLAGRTPKKIYTASPSSPTSGMIGS